MTANLPASIALAVCLLLLAGPARAGKTDIVEFGQSRMVGEVKRLERGKLYFKTDATDTIEIDWDDVTRLVTGERLRVERRNGTFSLGTFADGAPSRTLAFMSNGRITQEEMSDVVAFEQMEAGFWDRLDIKTSVGYSNSNSNDVEQLNFDATFGYDTENRSRELDLSSQRSASAGNDSSTRRTVDYQTLRFREDKWFTGWLGNYEDNDELELDYRFTIASAFGREFHPTTHQRYRAFAGLAVSEESFAGGDANTSLESVFGGSIDWFRFSSPELDLSSSLLLFPSITEWGRLRSRVDLSLSWEIVDDLYWSVSFYDDYDSEPLDENGDPAESINDYGVNTSLGWSW